MAAEVDAELGFHLEQREAELRAAGLPPHEATARARAEFGDVEETRASLRTAGVAHARHERRARWLSELLQDWRFAVRTLRRAPAFAAVVVLTIAIGIGATTTIFGVVDAILLRPLPYAAPERLVAAWSTASQAEYDALRTVRAFDAVGAYQKGVGFALTDEAPSLRVEGTITTPSLFATLGVPAALGRTLVAADGEPGRGMVVVLGHDVWRTRFGADPTIVGRAIVANGERRTVVGVMPPDFRFPDREQQLWVPLTIDPANLGAYWGSTTLQVVARLAPGVAPERALGELRALARTLPPRNPLWTPDVGEYVTVKAQLEPLQQRVVGDARLTLLVLLGAVGCVLLVVCANIANLLLARGQARSHELALRTALGAGRARLARQLLAESVLLALVGGALGVALAYVGTAGLVALLPSDTPRLAEIAVDGRVLGFALAAAVGSGLLFGLAPAWRLTRTTPGATLVPRGATGGPRRRLPGAFVLAQTALAVVLAAGAALLVQSFWRLQQVDPGFAVAGLMTARVSPAAEIASDDRRRAIYDALVERLGAVPSVERVAVASQVPFEGWSNEWAADIPGVTLDPNNLPSFARRHVSPDYFRTLGIPLRRGRGFTDADRADAALVAVIDEAAAAEFWPGGDPIGQRIGFPWMQRYYTIVGVVATAKDGDLRGGGRPALYTPFAQDPWAGATVVARTTLEPDAFGARVREAIAGIEPLMPVTDVRAMEARLAASVAGPRLTTLLVGGFALVAILLGALGLYGVMAYDVGQRTRELGVRLALGARARDVVVLVLRQGVGLALAGVALGTVGAVALTGLIGSLLFDVPARDPLTFAGVGALLVAVAAAATALPARRAARIDPMRSLRG